MNKMETIVVTYSTLAVMVLSLFLVVPLCFNYVLPPVVSVSPQPAYVLHWMGYVNWTNTVDLEAGFDVSPQFIAGANALVDIHGHFELHVEDKVFRNTTIMYTLYCNDQKVTNASEAFAGTDLKGGAGIFGIVIPSGFTKSGGNQLKIHVNVVSVTAGAGHYYFFYNADKVEVRLQNADNALVFLAAGFVGLMSSLLLIKKLRMTRY